MFFIPKLFLNLSIFIQLYQQISLAIHSSPYPQNVYSPLVSSYLHYRNSWAYTQIDHAQGSPGWYPAILEIAGYQIQNTNQTQLYSASRSYPP